MNSPPPASLVLFGGKQGHGLFPVSDCYYSYPLGITRIDGRSSSAEVLAVYIRISFSHLFPPLASPFQGTDDGTSPPLLDDIAWLGGFHNILLHPKSALLPEGADEET